MPPADDFHVVAGNGTAAIEAFEDCVAMGMTPDLIMTCCSGGGLTAGCLLAREALSPPTEVVAVEAEGFEKMARSLTAGKRTDLAPGGHSICDAINGLYTARIPFEIIAGRALSLASVTDTEALDAMAAAFDAFGLAVEPGGAVGLAALSGRVDLAGRTAVVILSGRNVEPAIAAEALQRLRA